MAPRVSQWGSHGSMLAGLTAFPSHGPQSTSCPPPPARCTSQPPGLFAHVTVRKPARTVAVSHHQPDGVWVRKADILKLAQGLLQGEGRLCEPSQQGGVSELGDVVNALWREWEKRPEEAEYISPALTTAGRTCSGAPVQPFFFHHGFIN